MHRMYTYIEQMKSSFIVHENTIQWAMPVFSILYIKRNETRSKFLQNLMRSTFTVGREGGNVYNRFYDMSEQPEEKKESWSEF